MKRWLPGAALLLGAACAVAADPPEWRITGRTLPAREFLQPTLDAGLASYRSCSVEGRLQGSAPTILPQLVRQWLAALAVREPALRVEVPPPYDEPRASGSETLRRFLEGKLDFAFLTRDLTASDAAAFRRVHGFDPLQIPVAGGSFRHFGFVDAVALIVNTANPVKALTLPQLDAILSKTRYRGESKPAATWGDVGVSEWADKPIRVVGHGAWAGEESARATFIRQRVMDLGERRGEWRDFGPADGGDAIVSDQVAADRYAIGFTGMGHLVKGTRTVALAPEAGAPFYEASYENVARAEFPLSRVFYLVVAKRSGHPLAPPLDAFVRFLLSREGQAVVLEQGVFIPLRARQAAESLRLLGDADCRSR